MTLYHSNDANNKSKEVNIIDPEEQIICKLILNDRRIPSSHSKFSYRLPPTQEGALRLSARSLIALIGHDPYLFPKTLFTSYRNEG